MWIVTDSCVLNHKGEDSMSLFFCVEVYRKCINYLYVFMLEKVIIFAILASSQHRQQNKCFLTLLTIAEVSDL